MKRIPALLMTLFCSLSLSLAESDFLANSQAWTVKAPQGESVQVKSSGDVLIVEYDMVIHQSQQVGHIEMQQVSAELLLDHPITLGKESAHVLFEALGVDPGALTRGAQAIWLRPIVEDETGARFFYYVTAYPHLHPGQKTWGTWMTQDFAVSEAGGAADQMYEVRKASAHHRPQGTLRFIGFELLIRGKQEQRVQGRVALGEIAFPPSRLAYRDPFAYADSLLPAVKGTYEYGLSVSNEFQGKPLRELTGRLTYDPDDLSSARQKLTIPLGPDDVYWVTYQLRDEQGKPILQKSFQYEVYGNPRREKLKAVDASTRPPFGRLRIDPEDQYAGVYPGDVPPQIPLRVFGSKGQTFTLQWEVLAYDFPTSLEKGEKDVVMGDEGYADTGLSAHWEKGRDAYRLKVAVISDGKTLDAGEYVFGRETDFSQPYQGRVGKITDRDLIKRNSYMRLTYVGDRAFRPKTEQDALREFEVELDEMGMVTRNITYMIEATDVEVLPGVFNFALLDQIMDAAADRGCGLTFRITVADGKFFPWQKYSRTRNYNGLEVRLLNKEQLLPVASDPRYIAIYDRAFRALFDRYQSHPGFQGYYVMAAMGDWSDAYVELPQIGTVSGYESSTAKAFREYLQETLGLSLEQLNKRWGASFASWEEIAPIPPDFSGGATPDLRRSWLDFGEFKASWTTKWFERVAGRIREYDKNHIIICYTQFPDGLLGIADYLHNGGNHFMQSEGALVDAWEKHRLGWISEPHHPYRWAAYGDPQEKGWVLDWCVFISTLQAGAGGANLQMYFDPTTGRDIVSHYGGETSMDRFAKYTTICNELQKITLAKPRRAIAVLHDDSTTLAKHRTVFLSRAKDLRRWFELLKTNGLPYEEFRQENLSQYKLILPNILDEVMREENVAMLDKFVRKGGRTVITPNTGRYSTASGQEDFVLLRRLGIAPPRGKFDLQVSDAIARADEGKMFPALDKGLPFYSLAQQEAEKAGGQLRLPENFQKWPYRFIPATDYFGSYHGDKDTKGKVLARFPDGSIAVSLHEVGKGEVLMLWGTPDIQSPVTQEFMREIVRWADGAEDSEVDQIPFTVEADNPKLRRHYALLFQEQPGTYQKKIHLVPDGQWFVDDIVSDERLGNFSGADMREKGLSLVYGAGFSPLKILRMTPVEGDGKKTRWWSKYGKAASTP